MNSNNKTMLKCDPWKTKKDVYITIAVEKDSL